MIAYMNPLQGDMLCSAVENEPVIGSKIYTLYKCYKNALAFCDFYLMFGDELQSEILGAICRYHGTVSVMCLLPDRVDMAELAGFVTSCGATELECLEPVMEKLLPMLKVGTVESCPALVMENIQAHSLDGNVYTNENSAVIHSILCGCFPSFSEEMPFSNWYVDTNARIRKADCISVSVTSDGRTVATAGVYSLSRSAGLIASVGTLPEYRGRGYAKRCISFCLNYLAERKCSAYIVAATEQLAVFYEGMGFHRCGVRCTAQLPQNDIAEPPVNTDKTP